ncbi:hypothetical protein [Candidatus Magnetomonas plexicatena]|uniref:hypothetical protein n=1 Tax=Candidatus Magnetomonas plexicatena TaxID=2552947 RepID=UPI001101B899|nr:hypothetical protein E2O03_012170 [Nitrospirales bacterium LBB_01]
MGSTIEIVREVIREEFINLSVSLLPYVSQEEMAEIRQSHDDDDEEDFNDNTNDFIDITQWLGR